MSNVIIKHIYHCSVCDSVNSDYIQTWYPGNEVAKPTTPNHEWRWIENKLICPEHKVTIKISRSKVGR